MSDITFCMQIDAKCAKINHFDKNYYQRMFGLLERFSEHDSTFVVVWLIIEAKRIDVNQKVVENICN